MSEAAITGAPRRRAGAPRRLVVLGVVVYCLVAWAALFQIAKFGLSLFQHTGANYAARSAQPSAE